MICLMPSAQNSATQTATSTGTHVDMTFSTNTTERHASGKIRDTKIKQQPRTKWEVQNEMFSTVPASDGVGGFIKI